MDGSIEDGPSPEEFEGSKVTDNQGARASLEQLDADMRAERNKWRQVAQHSQALPMRQLADQALAHLDEYFQLRQEHPLRDPEEQ